MQLKGKCTVIMWVASITTFIRLLVFHFIFLLLLFCVDINVCVCVCVVTISFLERL